MVAAFLLLLASSGPSAVAATQTQQALLALVEGQLTDLRQFVFMTDAFVDRPERSAAQQMDDLIRSAEVQRGALDGETIYGRYLLFDRTVLRVFYQRTRNLDVVLDALRTKYVQLVAREIEHWTRADLSGARGEQNLDYIARLLADYPGEEVEGVQKLRLSLEQRYRTLFDEELTSLALAELRHEIAGYRNLPAREFTLGRSVRFERLARRYLQAFGAWLRSGEMAQAGGNALLSDMRDWHPFFSLLLLEQVLDGGPEGIYALMLARPPEVEREVLGDIRRNQYSTQDISEEEKTRQARALFDAIVRRERDSLWELLGRTVLERTASILAGAAVLGVDLLKAPVHLDVDVLDRVAQAVTKVDGASYCRRVRARLREPEESAALSEALYGVVDRILLDAGIPDHLKLAKLEELTAALVTLQTRESKDSLLDLFESSDEYRGCLPDATLASAEQLLIGKIVAFVERSNRGLDDMGPGFAVVDRLMTLLREDVQLDRASAEEPELASGKVLRALGELAHAASGTMEQYIRWTFGGDESALAPVRCEAVIFHLADLCVEYARMGRFLRRDIDVRTGHGATEPPPVQEQLMELLRWINGSLGNVPSIPDVSYGDLAAEQTATLAKIYAGLAGDLTLRSPRFIETLLQLALRLTHVADAGDMKKFVYAPVARVLLRERAAGTPSFITSDMLGDLDEMWVILGERGEPFGPGSEFWP